MADQVQTPETGGGEGVAAPAQLEQQKENIESKEEKTEIQPDAPKEVKSEIAADVKPNTTTQDNSEIAKTVSLDTQVIPAENKRETAPAATLEEMKQEAGASEIKVDTITNDLKQSAIEAKGEANGVAENVCAPKDHGDWQQRESELLKKIDDLEKVKKERTQDSLQLELKVREEEIDLLKARVKNLETELQAALSKPSGKNHEMIENIKQQHEELLSKARGMIFDKTKMVKNQELQIEALNSQVISLKDINQITKDLLEIRNSEIKAMEDRLQAMEARFKAEKERYGLVLERAQTSSNINDDLRKEYETQLGLFKQLREKYDQRVQALVAENERLKGSNPQPTNGAGAGTSG